MLDLKNVPPYVKLEVTKEDLLAFANQIALRCQPSPQTPQKEILDISKAAEFLGLAKQTLYGYTSTNKIPFYKVNKKLHFKRKELLEWMETGKVLSQTDVDADLDNYLRRKNNK